MRPARPLEGKRILVLEDDFYLAKDEKTLLERAGAEVVGPFGNACQGSRLAQLGQFDGAIVDINLGLGPNFDFARALLDRGVPFLFATGYDAAIIPDELSHVARLEKPIRDCELISAIARLVDAPSEAG